ncbi:MAG: Holliday junction resolvase YqgF [Candidatus Saccharibacteria bacterium]|nr:Holliday junction resolvase YqgF [Candidatus Saccharibacteria bacterium]
MATTRNVIGLDVGDRRVGVAIASLEARMASPLLTIDRQVSDDIFLEISELLKKHDAEVVVVGLPRDMEGRETAQTRSARDFAATLEKSCGLPVHMQDEAATSIAAEETLKELGKPYQKGDIDKYAAAIILDDWLANAVQTESK